MEFKENKIIVGQFNKEDWEHFIKEYYSKENVDKRYIENQNRWNNLRDYIVSILNKLGASIDENGNLIFKNKENEDTDIS